MAALSAIPNSSKSICIPCTVWIEQHPKLATITAVAFGALGIALGAVAVTAVVTVAELLALAVGSGLSLSVALYIANVKRLAPDVLGQRFNLVQVMEDTLKDLKAGFYHSSDGKHHTLDLRAAAEGAVLFDSAGEGGGRPGSQQTRISVQSKDCLYVASDLVHRGLNPFVLDLGSDEYFGGGYRGGARAQEEDLCRRSGLALAVDTELGLQSQNFYPLRHQSPAAGVYVPDVPVFRTGSERGYAYLDRPFNVAFGIIAAYEKPSLDSSTGELRLRLQEARVTREKIRTVLEMAFQNGHQSLVLGALGCGAYRNPPGHVIEIFMDVIAKEYPRCFEEIVFAVLDDHNTGRVHNPEGNFKPFARCVLAAGGEAIDGNGRKLTVI